MSKSTNILLLLVIVFVLMQFARFVIPDFKLDNPPVTHIVDWSSEEVEQLWTATCADCHSHETVYPTFAYIAPVGWLVAYNVHQGRDKLNVSTNHHIDVEDMIHEILDDTMPPSIYTVTHPEADLTDEQARRLMNGLRDTFEIYDN